MDLARRIIEKLELTPARGFRSDDTVVTLAKEFSSLLHQQIPDDDWPQLIKDNQEAKGHDYCVTQDYLDANMVMADAFENVVGHEPDAADDDDAALWNAAWYEAKTEDFYHGK